MLGDDFVRRMKSPSTSKPSIEATNWVFEMWSKTPFTSMNNAAANLFLAHLCSTSYINDAAALVAHLSFRAPVWPWYSFKKFSDSCDCSLILCAVDLPFLQLSTTWEIWSCHLINTHFVIVSRDLSSSSSRRRTVQRERAIRSVRLSILFPRQFSDLVPFISQFWRKITCFHYHLYIGVYSAHLQILNLSQTVCILFRSPTYQS